MAYCVLRTDNPSSVDQRADLRSVRMYDGTGNNANQIAAENGVIVKIGALEDGQREVYTATFASSSDNLSECAVLNGVELFYDESRKHYLDEWINPKGQATRARLLRSNNLYSWTKEGFVNEAVPAVGGAVGIGTNGKLDASGTGFGVCEHIETIGRYTFYMIKIGVVEA